MVKIEIGMFSSRELDTGNLNNQRVQAPNTSFTTHNLCNVAGKVLIDIPRGMEQAANEAQSKDKWPKTAYKESTHVGIYCMVHR
jgi:hypothetical protein